MQKILNKMTGASSGSGEGSHQDFDVEKVLASLTLVSLGRDAQMEARASGLLTHIALRMAVNFAEREDLTARWTCECRECAASAHRS